MAERVGFEPTSRFLANTLSKRAPSATRTPLHTKTAIREYSKRASEAPGLVQELFYFLAPKFTAKRACAKRANSIHNPVHNPIATLEVMFRKSGLSGSNQFAEQFGQQMILWEALPEVLAEPFGPADT